MTHSIRLIQEKDDPHIAAIIREVLLELGVPKVGTTFEDRTLDCMFKTYQKKGSRYFVVSENDRVMGGGGIAQLENYEGNVCELQKMYFLPKARGRGIGIQMIDKCLEAAKDLGYDRCYLETMSYMQAATVLYERYGFELLDGPMGDTGHYACGVHMIKDL